MTVAEQFALLSIGLVTIMIRISIRWRSVGPSNWQVDDYLMPLTGVSETGILLLRWHAHRERTSAHTDLPSQQLIFIAEVVAAYLVGAKFGGVTNSYMTDEQRANIDPASQEHYNRVWGSKIQIIGWSFYAAILWGLKVCMAALFGRLTYVTS